MTVRGSLFVTNCAGALRLAQRPAGMRVYVATRFSRYAEARALMDYATKLGYVVTHDWTRTPEFDGHGHPKGSDEDLTPEVQAGHALDDINAVKRANLIAVIGDPGLWGALIEVGIAFAENIPIWIAEPPRNSIFWHLPNVALFDSEGDLRDALEHEARVEASL